MNTPHRHVLQHHIYMMTDRYRNIYTTLACYPKQREKEAALQTYFLYLWATQNHELYLWIFSKLALLYFKNVCLGPVTICYRMFHRHVIIIYILQKKNCIWQDHQMLYWDNSFTLHIYTVQFFHFFIKLSIIYILLLKLVLFCNISPKKFS